jgi:hypothetical protein
MFFPETSVCAVHGAPSAFVAFVLHQLKRHEWDAGVAQQSVAAQAVGFCVYAFFTPHRANPTELLRRKK